MRSKIVQFVTTSPKKALCIGVFFFLAMLPGLFQIKAAFNYKIWYNPKDPKMITFQKFEKSFGNDDSVIIAIEDKRGIFHPEVFKYLVKVTQGMWEIKEIVRSESLVNFNYIESNNEEIEISNLIDIDDPPEVTEELLRKLKIKALADKNISGTLLSKDGTMAIIRGTVRPAFETPPDYSAIHYEALNLINTSNTSGIITYLTGPVTLTHSFKTMTFNDLYKLLPIVYLLFTIILIYLYRRISGVLLPYLVLSTSVLMMMGFMGYAGVVFNTLSAACPTILLTVAIADAIHVLTVYYLCLGRGFSNKAAVEYTLTKNFYPTLLTTLTTGIGFISFSNAKVAPVAGLGLTVGVGVIFAWFVSYFILGPLLIFLPKFSKRINQLKTEKFITEIEPTKRAKSLVVLIQNFRIPIIIFSMFIFLSSLYLGSKMEVNMDPFDQFPSDHEVVKANKKMEKALGAINGIEIVVTTEKGNAKNPVFLKNVDKYQEWLKENGYLKSTTSLIKVIKQLNKTMKSGNEQDYVIPDSQEEVAQELFFYGLGLPPGQEITNLISIDEDAIRIQGTWTVSSSKAAIKATNEIESKAKDFGLSAYITGKMPLFHDLTPYVVDTFLTSFVFAFIAITIILCFVLGSIKLGLLALIPNVFPLAVGSAMYYLSGLYIDMGTVIIASVCLGIAVDDSIHFLFELKRLMNEGKTTEQAFEVIFTSTLPALYYTTLLLVAGFATFAFAEYYPNFKFGVTVALVLTIALIADVFLLPAILFKKKA